MISGPAMIPRLLDLREIGRPPRSTSDCIPGFVFFQLTVFQYQTFGLDCVPPAHPLISHIIIPNRGNAANSPRELGRIGRAAGSARFLSRECSIPRPQDRARYRRCSTPTSPITLSVSRRVALALKKLSERASTCGYRRWTHAPRGNESLTRFGETRGPLCRRDVKITARDSLAGSTLFAVSGIKSSTDRPDLLPTEGAAYLHIWSKNDPAVPMPFSLG